MKYTFVNAAGGQQTIDVPQEYIERQRKSLGIGVQEACELYVFDEGLAENETANELNAKAAGTKTRQRHKRKEDPIKRMLITYLQQNLAATQDDTYIIKDVIVTNPERIVQFKIDAEDGITDTYEITLSRKRRAK